MDFPCFAAEDPTEWLNHIEQFSKYQESIRLPFFLTTWKVKQNESGRDFNMARTGYEITWESSGKVVVRFGPTENENLDESLSRIIQLGLLREYQPEFES